MSSYDEILQRLARLEFIQTQSQPAAAAPDHQAGDALPGDFFSLAAEDGPLPVLRDDAPSGYRVPHHAREFFEGGRESIVLHADASRRLARRYPVPAAGVLQQPSRVDHFTADAARAAKITATTASALANRDATAARNDLQARIALPALHRVHQLRKIYDADGVADDFGELGAVELAPEDPRTTVILRDQLRELEQSLRDLLLVNRAAAAQLELQSRELVARASGFSPHLCEIVAQNPSTDPQRLFGKTVEDAWEVEQQRKQQAALLSIAMRAATQNTNHAAIRRDDRKRDGRGREWAPLEQRDAQHTTRQGGFQRNPRFLQNRGGYNGAPRPSFSRRSQSGSRPPSRPQHRNFASAE
jgi:hypothetical protein